MQKGHMLLFLMTCSLSASEILECLALLRLVISCTQPNILINGHLRFLLLSPAEASTAVTLALPVFSGGRALFLRPGHVKPPSGAVCWCFPFLLLESIKCRFNFLLHPGGPASCPLFPVCGGHFAHDARGRVCFLMSSFKWPTAWPVDGLEFSGCWAIQHFIYPVTSFKASEIYFLGFLYHVSILLHISLKSLMFLIIFLMLSFTHFCLRVFTTSLSSTMLWYVCL